MYGIPGFRRHKINPETCQATDSPDIDLDNGIKGLPLGMRGLHAVTQRPDLKEISVTQPEAPEPTPAPPGVHSMADYTANNWVKDDGYYFGEAL